MTDEKFLINKMAKAKVENRLRNLFASLGTANPATIRNPGSHLAVGSPEGGLQPEDPQKLIDEAIHFAAARPAAWDTYLDGIRRGEQIGYAYHQPAQPEQGQESASPDGSEREVPILISGQEIGKLLLETSSKQFWSQDDQNLIDTVAQQLAQQIETLRLLEEAQSSRNEAEQALQRLADLAGQTVSLDDIFENRLSMENNRLAFRNPVEASYAGEPTIPDLPVGFPVEQRVETEIRVGKQLAGHLELDGKASLSSEEQDLIDTISQRLTQQVENLQLLEESQYFRSETEEAIRRLTFKNWQAYLASTAKSDLGYQYDRNRVSKLDSDKQITGNIFPLRVREEVIGQLVVEGSDVQQGISADFVSVIIDRLSTHLEGLRLAEQREQALSETEILYSISARLSTAQSLEEALESVSEPARKTGARDSRLYFINLDDRGLVEGITLVSTWTFAKGSQPVHGGSVYRLSEYPAFWQILKDPNRPLLIENVITSPFLDDPARDLFLSNGSRAAVVLPMTISGRWVGMIIIHWDHPRAFTEQEERLYATLSRQAAVVVNNRMLLEQTRKRAQELQTVAQVSTAASTILDPKELLQSVVDLTQASFNLYHVQVYTFHEKDGFFEVSAGSGAAERQASDRPPYVKFETDSPVSRAGRSRHSVVVNDVQLDPGFVHNSLFPETRSEIAIPMVIGDRLLGVFNVQASTTNRFSREDVRTFTTLASQVAVALQNAELYAEQAATVERLRELDHLKSAFLANMSHELRTPLNSILGFADVLLLGLDGPLNETMENDVHLIEKNGKHLLSLINDVLDMAKIEAGKMSLSFEKFIVRELMEETLDITSSLAREKNLVLQILPGSREDLEIKADRVRLRQVFINIISNAVKFTEKGGVYIRIDRLEEEKIRISFRDTGIGIPKNMLEGIFESFSQVDTSTTRKAGGTGLGLPISRRLIEMHGGRMWAESSGAAGEGSTFYVELPLGAQHR